MGWREFTSYIDAMNRQVEGQRASHDSWQHADNDPEWAALRRQRDLLRGR